MLKTGERRSFKKGSNISSLPFHSHDYVFKDTKIKHNLMITERIFELRQIKECKSLLRDRECEIAAPILDSKEQLSVIYKIVKDECLNNKSLTKYEVKYYFVAITSFLYTPKAWMGEPFERGIRDEIASVLDYAPSHISNTFKTVTDWFIIYKDFREGVEYLYGKVIQRIK